MYKTLINMIFKLKLLFDLLSQVDQNFNNQHNRQLMAPKNNTDHEHHNPSDLKTLHPLTVNALLTRMNNSLCDNAE